MIKYTIAFDVNNTEKSPKSAVEATLEFLKTNSDFKIILVGNKNEIEKFWNGEFKENIEIVDKTLTATFSENLRNILDEDNSMNHAIGLVKNEQANAVLSSGDSGSYLTSCTFILKRLEGVSRPAFMPVMPTIKGKKFLLLDVGANVVVKASFLEEWAKVANEFAKVLLNIDNPRISLLNIGTEDYKGIDAIKEANKLLKDSSLNYIGFQEPRDILKHTTDVAIIDGYGGNLVLKSLEGAILSFKDLIKEKIMAKCIRKIGYLLLKGAFKDVSETLDYRNVGAAWVIGVDGIAIKSHGASDTKSFIGALNQIKIAVKENVLNNVREALEKNN